jgi:hypothetical protein
MTTVTVTNPGHLAPPDPDCLIASAKGNPSKTGIAELLVRLAQKIIENDLPLEWMRISQVSALCRRYRLNWQVGSTRVRDLELPARDYFHTNAAILGPGVQVEFQTEWSEKLRRQELRLRFRKMNPDGSLA